METVIKTRDPPREKQLAAETSSIPCERTDGGTYGWTSNQMNGWMDGCVKEERQKQRGVRG